MTLLYLNSCSTKPEKGGWVGLGDGDGGGGMGWGMGSQLSEASWFIFFILNKYDLKQIFLTFNIIHKHKHINT